MGIIDYLQDWSSGKKREYRIKKWIHTSDPNGISCVEPELYKDRFVKFICEDVFKQCWMSKQQKQRDRKSINFSPEEVRKSNTSSFIFSPEEVRKSNTSN